MMRGLVPLLILCASLAKADEWPRTCDGAARHIVANLTDAERSELKQAPYLDLFQFHFGLGMYIRNTYGLLNGNQELLDDCTQNARSFIPNPPHPDDISG